VTNGPYALKRWSDEAVTLEAFRDLSYPLGVGSYDAYAVPRRGFITRIERTNERIRVFGDIELLEKHMRSYDIVRKPLVSIPIDVVARSAPECRYMVIDAQGRVVLAGQVPVASDASFYIDLGNLPPTGRFTLSAELIVNGNALNPEISRFALKGLSDM